jgi:ribosomal protein S18 acetylase RimI-like enzyme
MNDPQIVIEPFPPRPWVEAVERGLRNYNLAMTGLVDFYPVGVIARDSREAICGGLLGNVFGRWLHVRSLWVEPRLRGRGCATDLMAAAESYARKRNCVGAFLQTASYEARPLYEKLGYRVIAELKDHPVKGHDRFFLAKELTEINQIAAAGRSGTRITMEPYASADEQDVIHNGIRTHAQAAMGLPERPWSVVNVFLRDASGEIVGGALGNEWGDWLFIAELWIDPPLRGNGHGSRLTAAIEHHAIESGCAHAFLDTFNPKARPLYEKLGYEIFGVLENHPFGISHYFMKKRLI